MRFQRSSLYETKDDFTNKRTTTAEIIRARIYNHQRRADRLNNLHPLTDAFKFLLLFRPFEIFIDSPSHVILISGAKLSAFLRRGAKSRNETGNSIPDNFLAAIVLFTA